MSDKIFYFCTLIFCRSSVSEDFLQTYNIYLLKNLLKTNNSFTFAAPIY